MNSTHHACMVYMYNVCNIQTCVLHTCKCTVHAAGTRKTLDLKKSQINFRKIYDQLTLG